MQATGQVFIQPSLGADTSLNIRSNGVAGTNDASLYVESGGTVHLGDSAQAATTVSLIVAEEAIFDGGKFTVEGNFVWVNANLVEFRGGAELRMSPSAVGNEQYTSLIFELQGTNAKVKLTSGKWLFDTKAGQQNNDYVAVNGGVLEISNTNTTLDVTMFGEEMQGEQYTIIDALEIVGEFANKAFHNADFNTEQIFAGGRESYRLTTK